MYVENIYLRKLGSAVKCIAVPEKYKNIQIKVYDTISKEEIDKITKLTKDKLFHLVKNRKELKQYNIQETELVKEKMELLDKISHRNDELYIGIYWYVFKTAKDSHRFQIVFSAKKDSVYVITSNFDDETLSGGGVKIHGMLDVDGCGEGELIIEKLYGGLEEALTNLEIYKQKADGIWKRIVRIKTRRVL